MCHRAGLRLRDPLLIKRLAQPTGEVASREPHEGDSDSRVVREAIIVHAGPGDEPIVFQSADGEIKFDAARIQRIVDVHNARMEKLAGEYGGFDKIPDGAYEPILDSHEDDQNDKVIGRLAFPFKFEVRDVPKVGKAVPCAVTKILFLGEDTVSRVKDGRIFHLSIGIDEADDTIGETSTVVKPAAPGAMLLSKGKKKDQPNNGGKQMPKPTKKLKAAAQKRIAKLAEMKTALTTMKSGSEKAAGLMKLTAKKAAITHRLKALCAAGKMTPAEYRGLVSNEDLTHLAALDEKTLGIALKPYDSREKPVIEAGQRGSSDAVDFASLGESLAKRQMKRLSAETKKDLMRLGAKGIKMSEDEKKGLAGGNELDPAHPGKDPSAVDGQAGDEEQIMKHMSDMGKHLAAGNVEEAKKSHEALKACMGHGGKHLAEYTGDVKSEDEKKSMEELQRQIDEQSTQMARMAGMIEEMMSVEKEEGHELAEGEEEEAQEDPAA